MLVTRDKNRSSCIPKLFRIFVEAGLSSNQRVIYHLPKNPPRFWGGRNLGGCACFRKFHIHSPIPPKKIGWPQERIKSYHLREIGCKTRDPGPQDATAKTSCRHKGKKGDAFVGVKPHWLLGGGLKYFLFSPKIGEVFQFDWYVSNGLVQPPTRLVVVKSYVTGWCRSRPLEFEKKAPWRSREGTGKGHWPPKIRDKEPEGIYI